jgi:hypothetical protein
MSPVRGRTADRPRRQGPGRRRRVLALLVVTSTLLSLSPSPALAFSGGESDVVPTVTYRHPVSIGKCDAYARGERFGYFCTSSGAGGRVKTIGQLLGAGVTFPRCWREDLGDMADSYADDTLAREQAGQQGAYWLVIELTGDPAVDYSKITVDPDWFSYHVGWVSTSSTGSGNATPTASATTGTVEEDEDARCPVLSDIPHGDAIQNVLQGRWQRGIVPTLVVSTYPSDSVRINQRIAFRVIGADPVVGDYADRLPDGVYDVVYLNGAVRMRAYLAKMEVVQNDLAVPTTCYRSTLVSSSSSLTTDSLGENDPNLVTSSSEKPAGDACWFTYTRFGAQSGQKATINLQFTWVVQYRDAHGVWHNLNTLGPIRGQGEVRVTEIQSVVVP